MIISRNRKMEPASPQASEKRMRRVWNKGDPTRGKWNNQYWYVDTFSRELAIAYIARVSKRKPETFDGER